jgi:purine-nucleoside phosphorylase
MLKQLSESADWLRKEGIIDPEIGIVLGSGLNQLAAEINTELEVSYADIPHFPLSTVEFHEGKLRYGMLGGKKVLAMQGRFHYYEGYTFNQVVYPIRVMKILGIHTLLLSNAAGALNLNWNKGDLMLIDDHINLQPGNPLIGKNEDSLGTRFPDMSSPYDQTINKLLLEIAEKLNINLRKGVYASVPGPNLETRAEYRFLNIIGADAVGMSTIPEVIAARHLELRCAAISVLTDVCDPDNLSKIEIAEIIAVAATADDKLTKIFTSLLSKL